MFCVDVCRPGGGVADKTRNDTKKPEQEGGRVSGSPFALVVGGRGWVAGFRGRGQRAQSPPAPAHGPAGAMFVKGGRLPPHGQRQPRPARGPARCSWCPVGRASRGARAVHGALPHTPRPPLTRPAPVSWPAPPAASLRGLQRQPVGQHGFYRVGPRGCGGAGPCVYLGQ